jgi:HK97 family phage major capsid protein
MSSDFETQRTLRGIQSSVDRLDNALHAATAGARASPPGRKLTFQIASQVARLVGADERAARYEQKSVAAPAATSVAGWAAELSVAPIPSFIYSLRKRSAWAGVLSKMTQVSLIGHGSALTPTVATAPLATIVSENAPIPIRRGAFTPGTLTPWKLASIFTVSQELASAPAAEPAIRALLEQSIGDGLDNIAFSGSGTGSIMTGAASVTASTVTPPTEAMRKDLEALIGALTNPSDAVTFIMSPARYAFASSVLPPSFGYPLAASSAVAAATVVAVDAQGFAAVMGGEAKILVTENPAVHEDDAPSPFSAVGSPNTVAAPLRSLFQSDCIGLRVIIHTGWAARSGAVASVQSVLW